MVVLICRLLCTGDPEDIRTRYVLRSLHKTAHEYDTAWMRAAFAAGGGEDAITNYSAVPLAGIVVPHAAYE